MESFKIDHFKKENPLEEFPKFNTLNPNNAEKLYKNIYERMSKGIVGGVTNDTLAKIIDGYGVLLTVFNAKEEGFLLENVFRNIKIFPNEKIYINWYLFDDVDEMRLVDLNNYFDDIWYPGSDDIDIFDSTFSWVLSISHEGYVKYLNINRCRD